MRITEASEMSGISADTIRYYEDETIPERKVILLAHGALLAERCAELDRCDELLAYKLEANETVERGNSNGKQ